MSNPAYQQAANTMPLIRGGAPLLISHRGNLTGPNPARENSPAYIREALDAGFDVEIDVRYVENHSLSILWLGHDEPQYPLEMSMLMNNKNKLWLHAKDAETQLFLLTMYGVHSFSHDGDPCALTSRGVLWALPSCVPYPGLPADRLVLIDPKLEVLEDWVNLGGWTGSEDGPSCAVCSDHVLTLQKRLEHAKLCA